MITDASLVIFVRKFAVQEGDALKVWKKIVKILSEEVPPCMICSITAHEARTRQLFKNRRIISYLTESR